MLIQFSFILMLTVSLLKAHEIEKSGTCPIGGVGICIHLVTCANDGDCPGNQKCCPKPCGGRTCQSPVPDCSVVMCAMPVCKPYYEVFTPEGQCCPTCRPEKSGTCPSSRYSVCVHTHRCANDDNCPGNQKCCPTACGGRTCRSPTPGKCPIGGNGTCGTIRGLICPSGTTCMFKGDFPDAGGKCCFDKPKPIDACIQPKKPGPCRAAIPRYFYNTDTCRCETFMWGGCQPNENNFMDIAHCQASCEEPMKSNPVCELPKVSGICLALMPRWFFNSTSGKCESFNYGGCGGNGNNFLTEAWCNTNCGCRESNICNLPIQSDDGGQVGCLARIPSFGYNKNSCKCEKFFYSGCGGNANRLSTLEKCEERCGNTKCETQAICGKPADPGPCEALFPRYYYDMTTCQCKKFFYGGCEGNGNNFQTVEMCLRKCRVFKTCDEPEHPNCLMPKKAGPCWTKNVKRFYYDPLTNKCRKFSWGGCQPNGNNFRNRKSCKQACKKSRKSRCSLQLKIGRCSGAIKRYYYNKNTGKCHTFMWSGCDSNANNFRSLRACKKRCM